MTETTNGSASVDRLQPDNARTVENFLTALQNQDIDAADRPAASVSSRISSGGSM